MKWKFGLQMKFSLLFLGFMVLITVLVMLVTEYNNEIIIERRFYDYAVSIGSLAASMVTADDVLSYKEHLKMDQEYYATMKELQRIQEKTQIHYLYVIYPISKEKGIYIYDVAIEEDGTAMAEEAHHLGDTVDLSRGFDMALKAMETGEIGDQFEYEGGVNAEDILVSAFVPIVDQKGESVAFAGVDMDIRTILDSVNQAKAGMLAIMVFLMTGCYILLLLIIRISILKPIQILKGHAEQISEGSFSHEIVIRGHDEISEITGVFNRMSKSIQNHMEEVQGINDAYHRYVPSELLNILGKEKITEVELGNRASRSVAVLTFQLSAAKEYMQNQNSIHIMEDMNVLFCTTIPIIMEQKGYVQSVQGTGMVAIYTEGVKGAVLSAISICQRLNRSRNQNNMVSPKVSIGIAYGGVLFGIVGHERRMASVSISAQTSMANYLQKLASVYGAKLFITAAAAEQIPDFHAAYHYRFVGMVENKYSKVVEKIYDIFDGDSDDQREGKERTKEQFEKGVELFCMHRFRESRQAFIEVLKRFRKDQGAKRYLQYCNQYYQERDTENISIFLREGNVPAHHRVV